MRLVMTYLYGHAIELATKSILSYHGMSLEELKKIRHDLDKCVNKASIHPEGKYLDADLQKIVNLLNPVYSGKHLEYHPGTMLMYLPDEKAMQNSVMKLISSLRKAYTPSRLPQ